MANCYVYIDKKEDGTPFYVGHGGLFRIKIHARDDADHTKIRLSEQCTRTIVFEGTKNACFVEEAKLIHEYGQICNGTGILVNKQTPSLKTAAKKKKIEEERMNDIPAEQSILGAYGLTMDNQELANFIGISTTKLKKLMKNANFPIRYKAINKSKALFFTWSILELINKNPEWFDNQ